jgi:uncharacterized damage-inducible protein DinB
VTTPTTTVTGERADILETLRKHRGLLLYTVRGLTDAQAAQSPTASALSLAGLIKHVATTERGWQAFATGGADAMNAAPADWENGFRMLESESLDGLLAAYDKVAARTDELVATADLDASFPLPQAPWFEPGASWSVRRVLLHLIAETSQHAGHADIIRETIDGQKSMG